ncbi:MAG: mechanosensitive ion channel [Gammaproteobacteria bacterium]|nr:mechanosensitive ion channel [Gammaproteobacteria bacterium]
MATEPSLAARLLDEVAGRAQSAEYWWQLGIILLAVALAWAMRRAVIRSFARAAGTQPGSAGEILAELSSRLVFPAVLGLGCQIAATVLARLDLPQGAIATVAVIALAFTGIRLLIELLKRGLRPGPLLVATEHVLAWGLSLLVAVYVLGWLEPITAALDSIALPLGEKSFSLLDALRIVATLLAFLLVAAWLGALATRGIMASEQLSIGLRVGISKVVRLLLLVLAALVALDLVGVDLAGLAIFSGALGIGLGFGLQRIAANYISGFILVGDRSIRQGDVITIGERFGVVRELRARYVVVRDRDGVDTLIPNENLISSEVINWSYGDRAIRLKLPLRISYRDDPHAALRLLLEAAGRHPRVLKEPKPASRVIAFGDNGIELELRFWIMDPEDGIFNVRSDLHLTIWDLFREAGFTIPYPQRDLHLRDGWNLRPGGSDTPAPAPSAR